MFLYHDLCPGEELNLHVLRHTHLKRACLPGFSTRALCRTNLLYRSFGSLWSGFPDRSGCFGVGVSSALVDRDRAAHSALAVVRGLAAYKVELGAARARAAQHLDLVYHRRVEREYLFNPHARGDAAHRKGRPCLGAVLDRKDSALKRLLADVF